MAENADTTDRGQPEVQGRAAEYLRDTLRNPLSFIRSYIAGDIPPEQRMILDLAIIQAGGLDKLVPPEFFTAYGIARLNSLLQLEHALRLEIKNGQAESKFNIHALALFMLDPTENSYAVICRTIRRILHYQVPARTFLKDRWEKQQAEKIIREVDAFLIEKEGSSGLRAYYDANFASVSYEASKDPLGEETKVLEKKEQLTIFKALKLLEASSSALLTVNIISFFVETFLQDPDTTIRDHAKQELEKTCARITSPMALWAMCGIVDVAIKHRSLASLKNLYIESVRRFLSTNTNAWDTLVWCDGVSFEGHIGSQIANIIRHEAPVQFSNAFANGFLAERDMHKALVGFNAMPHQARVLILDQLFGMPDLGGEAGFMKLAIFIRQQSKLTLQRIVDYCIEHTEINVNSFASLLRIVGISEDDIRNFLFAASLAIVAGREKRVQEAHAAPRGTAAAVSGRTRVRVESAVAVLALTEKKKGFVQTMCERVVARSLPPDIAVRTRALGSIKARLKDSASTLSELRDETWGAEAIRNINTEPSSVLNMLGITEVRFTKTQSFTVELISEQETYSDIHLQDDGSLTMPEFPADKAWLREIIETEILRLFVKLVDKEEEGYGLREVLILLGLEEYREDTAAAEVAAAAETVAADHSAPPETPVTRTRDLLAENYGVLQAVLEALRQYEVAPKGDFAALARIFYGLQAEVQVNKRIPPDGLRVLPPEGHVLAPFISGIDFYNVSESRAALRQLDLAPEYFHIAEDFLTPEGELDAYLGIVQMQFPDGQQHVLHVCITPRFDVYIIGADPKDLEEDKDPLLQALHHLILEAFRCAVMREYDPERHETSGHRIEGRRWAVRVRDVIREVTTAAFPVLVATWQLQQPAEEDADGRRRRATGTRVSRDADFDKLFDKLFSTPGPLEEQLASRGAFVRACDYIRLFPDEFGIFPREAWTGNGSGRHLKKEYADIYMPLDTPAKVRRALDAVLNEKLFSSEKIGRIPRGQIEACLIEARKSDPSISERDIEHAIAERPNLSASRLFIATSEPFDYRLPFLPRDSEIANSLPCIFEDSDFDVTPGTPLEVITVISGNRARFASSSSNWLLGSHRSEEMTFAAERQRQYRTAKAGEEIVLAPRARAILVWEFTDGEYAFIYLDAARDTVNPRTLGAVLPAEDRLRHAGRIHSLLRRAQEENAAHAFTDFTTIEGWKPSDLEWLAKHFGVIELHKDARGRIVGVTPLKRIRRKKIAILTEEQIGYKQFRFEPTTLDEYQEFLNRNGVDRDAGLPYDPRTAMLQRAIDLVMK